MWSARGGCVSRGLKQAFQNGQLNFQGDLKLLAQPKTFAAWLRPLSRQDWVVYLKRPFGGPEYVLQYLGRYTIAWPSPTIAWSRLPTAKSPFAGVVERLTAAEIQLRAPPAIGAAA
jgi:Putative transposase